MKISSECSKTTEDSVREIASIDWAFLEKLVPYVLVVNDFSGAPEKQYFRFRRIEHEWTLEEYIDIHVWDRSYMNRELSAHYEWDFIHMRAAKEVISKVVDLLDEVAWKHEQIAYIHGQF